MEAISAYSLRDLQDYGMGYFEYLNEARKESKKKRLDNKLKELELKEAKK